MKHAESQPPPMVEFNFKNKHALVCGASSGIGQATATAFARAGARLTLLARREKELQQTVELCLKAGAPAVHGFLADLEKPSDWLGAFESHLQKNGPLTIFINNAGGPPPGPLAKADPKDISQAMQRLFLSAHLILQKILPGMVGAGYGRIVNVISTSVREPIANLGVSNVVRGATASWAKTLANELPPQITVNNVLPGYTKTERLKKLKSSLALSGSCAEDEIEKEWISLVPERRLAEASEIANAILFLCCQEAGYIRGVSLAVDGGRMKSI